MRDFKALRCKMSIKCKVICLSFVAATILSCENRRGGQNNEPEEFSAELLDSTLCDTLTCDAENTDLTIDEGQSIDGSFDDFLFVYLHDKTLRRNRTANPIRLERTGYSDEMLEHFDPDFEFSFLSGDYFTTLYGNVGQMQGEGDEEAEDSVVSLQRINLNDGTIRNYTFCSREGRWYFEAIREATFQDDELCDFYGFYARFCTDSLFQSKSVADPLHVVVQDGSEEGIDGIIDADQWHTFCPEVPAGIISNIRKGQYYTGYKIVMRKSGFSNGMQELFTFTKGSEGWQLTRYEN